MYDSLSNDYDIPITASSSEHDYDIPQGLGEKKNKKKKNSFASQIN
jgi:hypothetical protein